MILITVLQLLSNVAVAAGNVTTEVPCASYLAPTSFSKQYLSLLQRAVERGMITTDTLQEVLSTATPVNPFAEPLSARNVHEVILEPVSLSPKRPPVSTKAIINPLQAESRDFGLFLFNTGDSNVYFTVNFRTGKRTIIGEFEPGTSPRRFFTLPNGEVVGGFLKDNEYLLINAETGEKQTLIDFKTMPALQAWLTKVHSKHELIGPAYGTYYLAQKVPGQFEVIVVSRISDRIAARIDPATKTVTPLKFPDTSQEAGKLLYKARIRKNDSDSGVIHSQVFQRRNDLFASISERANKYLVDITRKKQKILGRTSTSKNIYYSRSMIPIETNGNTEAIVGHLSDDTGTSLIIAELSYPFKQRLLRLLDTDTGLRYFSSGRFVHLRKTNRIFLIVPDVRRSVAIDLATGEVKNITYPEGAIFYGYVVNNDQDLIWVWGPGDARGRELTPIQIFGPIPKEEH